MSTRAPSTTCSCSPATDSLQATPPGGQRPDLTELFGAQVQPAGYEFSGIGSSESISGEDLRVFAVVDERASEIRAGSPQTMP